MSTETKEAVVNRENPLFGRKVYFINPPLIIENYVVEELRSEEYEAFVIDNYHHAKPVLENNKDAMAYFYIDDEMDYDQWYNYIKSFNNSETLKTIFIGVISIKANINIKEKFMMDLKLPGGFIMLNNKIDITSKKIRDILDLNGAKGRRKYIRLASKDLREVNGYLAYKDKLYNFSIDDISSVGFSCSYPMDMIEVFPKNLLHPCVSLTLGRRTIVVSSVVFGTRNNENKGSSVLLFTKEVSKEVRKSIRNFIFDILDEKHNEFVKNSIQDLTDYSKTIEVTEDTSVPAFADVADSFMGTLEDLPEIPES